MTDEQDTQTAALDLGALDQIEAEAAGDEIPPGETMPEQAGPETAELIAPIVQLATSALAPNWHIQKAESDALAEAYADVLDKYFPDVGSHFGVELNALLITAAIFTPRIGKPRFVEEKKRAANDDQSDSERAEETAPPPKGQKPPKGMEVLAQDERVGGQE